MMRRYQIVAWACVAVIAFGLKAGYDARRRAEGVAAVERKARVVAEVNLKNARARVDTFYVIDTIPFWRTVTRTERLLDTLIYSDTVTLTRRESVLVFVADSVVNQCKNIVTLCEQRVAVRDSLLQVMGADRDYWRHKAEPPLIHRASTQLAGAVKWLAIGYTIRWATAR